MALSEEPMLPYSNNHITDIALGQHKEILSYYINKSAVHISLLRAKVGKNCPSLGRSASIAGLLDGVHDLDPGRRDGGAEQLHHGGRGVQPGQAGLLGPGGHHHNMSL